MTTYKDSDLREALRRKYADMPSMPADLGERLMQRVEAHEQNSKPRRARLYGVIGSIAASVVLMIMFGVGTHRHKPLPTGEKEQPVIVHKGGGTSLDNNVAHAEQCARQHAAGTKASQPVLTAMAHAPLKHREADRTQTDKSEAAEQTLQDAPTMVQPSSVQHPIDAQWHYASHVSSTDSSYISPVRMDEYVRKLAAYNGVKPETLDCNTDSTHTASVCEAYVFPDTKEVDVFGRLLLAAIAYDDTMPGYLFNYTHQQIFFTLNDLRLRRRYLWIAERIAGDRILLYCANSPIGAEVPSECYQKFRNKLTNTINPKTTKL